MIKEVNKTIDRYGNRKFYFDILGSKRHTHLCIITFDENNKVATKECTCTYGTIQSSQGKENNRCKHIKECLEFINELRTEEQNEEKVA